MVAMRTLRTFAIAGAILATCASVSAKEIHFEQVRVLLISKAARCTSCHVTAEAIALNAYGARLTAILPGDPLADRIAALEAEPSFGQNESERKQSEADRDVDQDGVANWIEILAGANPGDRKDKPDPATVQRIERVVSCNLCHTATGLPGEGLAANPHNALGKLLAKTYKIPGRRRKPQGKEAIQAAAERTPMLTRLSLIAKKKPRKSKATYWQKIRLLHAPTEPGDAPDRAALLSFKRKIRRQKRRKTRDPNLGLACEAHKPDGFLLDADGKLE